MRFHDGPSTVLKSGSVSFCGGSYEKYLSACRICSLDCGSLVNARDTISQPPRLYNCVAHAEPSSYGNSNDSRNARGACLNCSVASSCEPRLFMNASATSGFFAM